MEENLVEGYKRNEHGVLEPIDSSKHLNLMLFKYEKKKDDLALDKVCAYLSLVQCKESTNLLLDDDHIKKNISAAQDLVNEYFNDKNIDKKTGVKITKKEHLTDTKVIEYVYKKQGLTSKTMQFKGGTIATLMTTIAGLLNKDESLIIQTFGNPGHNFCVRKTDNEIALCPTNTQSEMTDKVQSVVLWASKELNLPSNNKRSKKQKNNY